MARRRRRRKVRLIENFGGRRGGAARQTRHAASRCLYARAGDTVAVVAFVRAVHRAGATAEYNNGSDELLNGTTIIRGPGKVHGGAGGGGSGGRNKGAAVDRRSFPSLKAGCTVDAHIEADERDVASSFVPGHCSRRKAPYTAKDISLLSPTAGRECSRHQ